MRDVSPAKSPSVVEFRKRMGLFTTGVCVVAVETVEQSIAAMTINSFVSVSLEPMLVCWSVHNSSSQFDQFVSGKQFTVSILAADQAELALRYAARGDTLLLSQDFDRSAEGLPVIAGSIGHFECSHWAAHPAGDHTMIVGEVTGISPDRAENPDLQPLGFFNGQFCSIGE